MTFADSEAGDVEYQRKCALYEEIFKSLDLDAWLYENPSEAFEMMAFSGIYQSFQFNHHVLIARAYQKRWNDGMSRLLNDIENGVEDQ